MGALLEIGLSNAIVAAMLAVPAAAAGLLCRRPALTHSLWLLVFLKLVTPPLFSVAVPWPVETATVADAGVESAASAKGGEANGPPAGVPLADAVPLAADGRVPAATHDEAVDLAAVEVAAPDAGDAVAAAPPFAWAWLVAAIWPLGSLCLLAAMTLQVWRFQRLLRHARRASPAVQALTRALAQRLDLKDPPLVWLVPGAISPMLWALGTAPRLLFPAGLLDRLDRQQLETLLAHELAHYRRRDHWVRFLEIAVLCLYWWHPIVWWARRELHEAEEQCCDAWVVWTQAGEGRSYALALIQTVAFFSHAPSPLPVAASGIGQPSHLRRRLTMIMQGKTPHSLSWLGGVAVLGLGILLPVVPLRAQAPAEGGAAPKGNRQEKIEILKKAIKILEEQEAAGPKKEAVQDDQRNQEIAKAKHAVAAAANQVDQRRKELDAAQAKLQQSLAVLAKLTGNAAHVQGWELRLTPDWGKPRAGVELRRSAVDKGIISVVPAPANGRYRAETTVIRSGAPPTLDRNHSGSDLEKKLDRLLKEVDELRQELRGSKRPSLNLRKLAPEATPEKTPNSVPRGR